MKFLCEQCNAKYQIADDKIVGDTVRLKCRKCGNLIEVRVDLTKARPSVAPASAAHKTTREPEPPGPPPTPTRTGAASVPVASTAKAPTVSTAPDAPKGVTAQQAAKPSAPTSPQAPAKPQASAIPRPRVKPVMSGAAGAPQAPAKPIAPAAPLPEPARPPPPPPQVVAIAPMLHLQGPSTLGPHEEPAPIKPSTPEDPLLPAAGRFPLEIPRQLAEAAPEAMSTVEAFAPRGERARRRRLIASVVAVPTVAAAICVAAGIHLAQRQSANVAPSARRSIPESQAVRSPPAVQGVAPLPPTQGVPDPSGSAEPPMAASPEAAPPPSDAPVVAAASASASTTVASAAEESSPSPALASPTNRAPVAGKDVQPIAAPAHDATPGRTAPHAAIVRAAPF